MFRHLRAHFPILSQKHDGKPIIYFDNAATTQKPQEVLDAIIHFYTTANANVGRGIYSLAEQATELYENARATVAQFIEALPEEIVFTNGATAGINFIAYGWALQHLKKGDVILVTYLEHHANIVPWQNVCQQTGAQLRYLALNEDGTLALENLSQLCDSSVKLLAITHISNALGTVLPLEGIIKQARMVGAKVLIDAAQSAPHGLVTVRDLQPDFLVFSGHKMLAPTGIGVLYVNKKMHNQLTPLFRGGGMVNYVNENSATWITMPHQLEAGTPPIAQAIGLAAAINYLQKNVDAQQLQLHYAQLCSRLIEGLVLLPGVRVLGALEQLKKFGHIVSFVIEGAHGHDVAAYLSAEGIFVRAGHHCAQPLATQLQYEASVRVSFYFYNTLQEVEILLEALQKLIKINR